MHSSADDTARLFTLHATVAGVRLCGQPHITKSFRCVAKMRTFSISSVILILVSSEPSMSLMFCDVVEQTSSTPCVVQRSFGCRVGDDGERQLWIRHGCRGTFDCDGKRVLCTRPRADKLHNCSCERSFLDTLPGGVCIRGGHALSSSVAFWHFIHGHLLPTFQLISTQGQYRPDLQVVFEQKVFTTWTRRYMDFYHALFDLPVQIGTRCSGMPSHWLVKTYPRLYVTIMRRDNIEEYKHADNSSIAAMCEHLPSLHMVAAARRYARPRTQRLLQIVFVHRNATAESTPEGTVRGIENVEEVVAALKSLARGRGAILKQVILERLPPLAQVDLFLETDVLISYHGSGLGGGHVWMPPGGVVVEIMPHKFDYCVVATCVAHSGKAHFLVTTAATRLAKRWKPGGWFAKVGGPPGLRKVHLPSTLLTLLSLALSVPKGITPREALQTAAALLCTEPVGRGHSKDGIRRNETCRLACQGKSLQIWEAASKKTGTPSRRAAREDLLSRPTTINTASGRRGARRAAAPYRTEESHLRRGINIRSL